LYSLRPLCEIKPQKKLHHMDGVYWQTMLETR
jgi:hypothetical protein